MKNRNLHFESIWKARKNWMVMTAIYFMCFGVIAQTKTSQLHDAIEAHPDSLELHQDYIKASDLESPELKTQYDVWIKQFPKNAIVPFALGEAFYHREWPSAKPLLLKAVERNPSFAKAYFYLWIDGERWGEFEKSREYLKKAKEAEPTNPDYAFYYANSFSDVDATMYRKLTLEMANSFPDSERGAQALYWLAHNETDTKEKKEIYELLKNKFPPAKFSWSSSGMSGYFDLLLKESPEKAVTLAQNMLDSATDDRSKGMWKSQLELAKNIKQAKSLMSQNNANEAFVLLDSTVPMRWSGSKNLLLLLKAEAMDKSGKTKMAYDELKVSYATSPEKQIKAALGIYGKKLNKDQKEIEKDVWFVRDTIAKPATDFTLKTYFAEGKSSLSDYKGKVVLLTYWFPGCGPCRGEFPHFQAVVDKFKGQDLVYLGLNIVPDQNDYVVPFMKSSGYSFIPLEDYKDREKGNLNNGGAAPVNFLIDRDGNVVFSNFRTDEHNKDVLEEMISSLLNRNK